MQVRDAIGVIRSEWVTLCAFVLFCLTATLSISLLITPLYESSSQIAVPNDRRITLSGEVATSANLDRVRDSVDLGGSSDRLTDRVSVRVGGDRRSLIIAARDESPSRATQIVTALSEEFVKAASRSSGGEEVDTNIRLVVGASVPSTPVTPRIWHNLAAASLVGAVGGFGLALARCFRKPTERQSLLA